MKEKINRLIEMAGADRGFYILALHSFIEHYMKNEFPLYDDSWTITFNTNLYNYKKYLIEKNPGRNLNELSSFKAIMDQYTLIEDIRHDFAFVSAEEVKASTFNFLQFCKAVGIEDSSLSILKNRLNSWEHRACRSDEIAELEEAKTELVRLRKENSSLMEQHGEFVEMKAVKKYLESRIETLSLEMELERQTRAEEMENLSELKLKREDLAEKILQYEHIDKYLKNLLRVSLYTRTRMDYERSLVELTEEQKDVLKCITLKSDFLVKGGAGTGKTLILLEAMKAANAGILAFAGKKLLLLTYTNTLVKFDRYISDIMEINAGDSQINTVDSYLNGIFEREYPDLSIDYSIMNGLCKEMNSTGFFDNKQLKVEIEDFLYGYNISEQEYIADMINRKGLKSKLSAAQRQEIWDIKSSMEEIMIGKKSISRAFSRILLNRDDHDPEFDHIFIDESQDLYPVELQLLKKNCRSGLIMAGDTDQSIYGIGSPYQRSNINTGGRTKILKTNFRNSVPIHKLAEEFRKKSSSGFDRSIVPEAFREGPVPELYLSDNTEVLYDQMIEKVKIFINTIEYDPENICILAPTAKFLGKIAGKLEKEGYSTVNIKDQDFSFKSRGRIRLSPLHSSKGLDIPVVILFIPVLFYNRELEPEDSRTLVRNLIYVSMTRAMENLNIFTKEGSADPVISDLVRLLEDL